MRNNRYIVTGGTRGIGRAIVNRLIEDNNDVMFTWLESESESNDIIELGSQKGLVVEAFQCDLTDLNQTAHLASELTQRGPYDGLINCATGRVKLELIENSSIEQWKESLSINLLSPLILCKELMGSLRKGSSIINFSSPNVQICQEGTAAYSASKAALEIFSKILAREAGVLGIRVNTVRPGPTLTDGMLAIAEGPEEIEQLTLATPLGGIAKPEQIADAVIALCNHDNRWVSGDCLNVSGGLF